MPRPHTQDAAIDHASEAELVRRASERDEAAVRALTLRHNRRLYRIARSILRNDSEAEDVVQETYVRAFTSLDLFRSEASFGTWLTRIALNEALGRIRRRRPTVDWEAESETRFSAEIIRFPNAASDPERALAQSEVRRLLEEAIDRLPNGFRMAFVARIVEGMSIEETAELLGIRPETVKTRLHRARRLLRKALERELGPVFADAFPFAGQRCAHLTETVIRRISALV